MSHNETSEVLLPSDEVEAYPLVLKLCSINWIALAAENPDSDKVAGFGLAAAFCSVVVDDLFECRAIGKISGIHEGCNREFEIIRQPLRPLHF